MAEAALLEKSQCEEMRERAQAFHNAHPEVWLLFERFTFEKIHEGRKHWGARGVWERLRWDTPVGADGVTELKLNDHYHTFYARRFMKIYPAHDGFFRIREQTSKKKLARGRPEIVPSQLG